MSGVPGVPQQVHPLGVELGEEVGGGGILHGHPHAVQGGHALLLGEEREEREERGEREEREEREEGKEREEHCCLPREERAPG